MRKSAVAVLAVMLLTASALLAQSAINVSSTNGLSNCQTANYHLHCVASATSDGGVLSFDVVPKADGTFTNGSIILHDATGALVFNGANFTGTAPTLVHGTYTGTLSGNFSGTRPDGATFNGRADQSVSRYSRYEYGRTRYFTHLTDGSESYTVTLAQ